MLEIKRYTRIQNFQTPIKATCIIELEIYDARPAGSDPIENLELYSDDHLPLLKVTNLKNENLRVLQTSMVPENIQRIAEDSDTVPIYIRLNEKLQPGEIITIRFEFLSTWEEDKIIRHSNLFYRYAQFEEPFSPISLISEDESSTNSSTYYGVFVPEKYSIENVKVVSLETEGVDPTFTHKDENSFLLRWYPKPPSLEITWQITAPTRVTMWLVIGICMGLLNPILAYFLSLHILYFSN